VTQTETNIEKEKIKIRRMINMSLTIPLCPFYEEKNDKAGKEEIR
jgi:uncharacterized protein YlaN (UPF0358 family)